MDFKVTKVTEHRYCVTYTGTMTPPNLWQMFAAWWAGAGYKIKERTAWAVDEQSLTNFNEWAASFVIG